MAARLDVAVLGREGEPADGLFVRRGEHVAFELAAAQGVGDADREGALGHRLGQVAVAAELQRLLPDLGVLDAADHERGRLGVRAGKLPHDVETRLAAQAHVAEEELGRTLVEEAPRLDPVDGLAARVAAPL